MSRKSLAQVRNMDKMKVFLSRYTPRLVSAEILERIFVQREELARELVERIRQSALTAAKHHTLLAGPRGIGKSHLSSLVYHRIRRLPELQDRLLIGWLAEEEWSITSFLDFLLCVLRALKEESGKTRQPSPDVSGVESLYEQPADAVPKAAQIVKEFIGNRTLLLLVENFDELLGGLGKEEQKQLRDFLDESSCMVLATAQSVFKSAKKGRSPFFDFFQQEQLEELDVDDARELLAKIANYKGNRELELFIKNGKGRDRLSAVHHLAGGNHRLYIIFSEFLTHRESLDELVEVFMRTLDDLTPYYQDRMRSISPQQRKILNFLCQEGKAVPVKDIAGRCLMTHQTASSQLKKLLDLGYVSFEASGRVSYYEVREPMMRFCLEVKRLRGEPISLLVDFLRLWYKPFELQDRLKLLPSDAALERKYLESALELAQKDAKYFSDRKLSKKIGDDYVRPGDVVSVRQATEEKLSTLANGKDWFEQGSSFLKQKRWEDALTSFEQAIALNYNDEEVWHERGWALQELNREEEALASFKRAIELNFSKEEAWFFQGIALDRLERYEEALASFNQLIQLNSSNNLVWMYKGLILLYDLKRYAEALESVNKAIELEANDDAWFLQGMALNQLERYEEALVSFQKLIKLNPNYKEAWFRGAIVLGILEQYEESLKFFNKATELNPNIELDPNYHSAWLFRGLVLNELQRHEEAITSFDKAIALDDRSPAVFFYRVDTLLALNRWEEGMTALEEALERFTQTTDSCDTETVIRHLLNSTNDAATWKTRIANLVKIYDKYKLAASVWLGIVRCIPALMSEMISDTAARKWLQLWQETTSDRRDFQVPLRLLAVAVRYKETKGDRRVLLEVPIEERELLKPLVEGSGVN